MSRTTLDSFETGKSDPALSTVERLVRVLEGGRLEMIDRTQASEGRGVGVRPKAG